MAIWVIAVVGEAPCQCAAIPRQVGPAGRLFRVSLRMLPSAVSRGSRGKERYRQEQSHSPKASAMPFRCLVLISMVSVSAQQRSMVG